MLYVIECFGKIYKTSKNTLIDIQEAPLHKGIYTE
jgi:hypothetical protein